MSVGHAFLVKRSWSADVDETRYRIVKLRNVFSAKWHTLHRECHPWSQDGIHDVNDIVDIDDFDDIVASANVGWSMEGILTCKNGFVDGA